MKILFLCHANTSRSIMAEALLRRILDERGATDRFEIHSAGVAPFARDGALVSLDTRFALRDHGVHLPESVASRALRRNLHLLEEADLVLSMTEEQRRIVEQWPELVHPPIQTLREFVGEEGDIADPAGASEDVFERTCAEIRRCLEKALPRLLEAAGAR